MSTLFCDANGKTVQAIRAGNVQNVSYSGSAAQTTPFNNSTTFVRVVCSSDAFYVIGTAPTADSTKGIRLPAGVVEYIPVPSKNLISFIQVSASGTANVVEAL